VGREEELADIHAKLQEGQGVIVCAVEGMGGVGKTEIALQYATRYQREYVAQYWLSLRGGDLAQEVLKLSSNLDLPEAMKAASADEQAAWCWQNWLPETGKLLVILDDVPKAESIPDVAMPNDPRVRVLVTTRERELNVGFESVPLPVLSEKKALELLRKIVGASKVDKELVTVKEICNTLGCLPLGIELIGEYLSKNRFLTFAKLQERLNLADESIGRERKGKFYGYRGVEAAIQLSWDDISTGSQRVAMLLGLFAPVEIFWELVAWIGASAEITEVELNEARGQLDRLHLIQPIDEECSFYKIHTLVREFFRAKLLKAEENHQFRQAFVNILLAIAKELPSPPTRDLIARVAPAIPHLDMLSREMLDDIPNPEEDLIWAFIGIARFYEGQSLYSSAMLFYQNCLENIKSYLGLEHPTVGTILENMAKIDTLQVNFGNAETRSLEAISVFKKALGNYHQYVAYSLNSLANCYYEQCRYKKAEDYLLQSQEIIRITLGEDSYLFAINLSSLANLYRIQQKFIEAESLFLNAFRILRTQFYDDDLRIATILNNWAELYKDQKKYKEAETLFSRSLSIWYQNLESCHIDIALGLNNLAECYRLQNKNGSEVKFLYLKAQEIMEKALGENHIKVKIIRANMRLFLKGQNL
jgi:hypothetical protein